MTQKDCVLQALRKLGGIATLSQLYSATDVSLWATKTPFASIRRIVQTNVEFFKVETGLWGLSEQKAKIYTSLGIEISAKNNLKTKNSNNWSHAYYQGLIAQIGNFRHFQTYIPAQDKNKVFVNQKLADVASLQQIYDFSFKSIVSRAKNVDVIWFNERNLPNALFEVEHSTDFKNSLNKFYEFQDFNAKMFIVANKARRREFESVIAASIYKAIASNVKFADYESIVKLYEKESQALCSTI